MIERQVRTLDFRIVKKKNIRQKQNAVTKTHIFYINMSRNHCVSIHFAKRFYNWNQNHQ